MNEYKMIPLPYTSLEPIIDDLTLSIHYGYHYKTYTDKLNKLLKEINFSYNMTAEYLASNSDIVPSNYQNEILYNLGGYLNHTLYFDNLTPVKKEVPTPFLNLINKYFTSFDNFKDTFISYAKEVKGSGYTFLVLDNNNPKIINLPNQDSPYYYGMIPLMNIDVWEHAYYLEYTYKREEYLNNIFNIIDWDKVYNRYLDNIK